MIHTILNITYLTRFLATKYFSNEEGNKHYITLFAMYIGDCSKVSGASSVSHECWTSSSMDMRSCGSTHSSLFTTIKISFINLENYILQNFSFNKSKKIPFHHIFCTVRNPCPLSFWEVVWSIHYLSSHTSVNSTSWWRVLRIEGGIAAHQYVNNYTQRPHVTAL